jgi:hypothetical protein
MALDSTKLEKLEAAALAWVNQTFDLPMPLLSLPPGQPRNENCCPIARALNENCEGYFEVHLRDIYRYEDDQHLEHDALASVPTSKEARLFIEAFDEGWLPHLIEEEVATYAD